MAWRFDCHSHTGTEEKNLGLREAEIEAENLHKPGTLRDLHPQ